MTRDEPRWSAFGRPRWVSSRAYAFLRWVTASLILNLIWEVVQLPLFVIPLEGDMRNTVFGIAHCTLGDVVLAAVSYIVAALALRDSEWPSRCRGGGVAIAVLVGASWTVYAEWRNVYVLGNWAYTSAMPTVGGIGLSPLLQWIVIPIGLAALECHRTSRRGEGTQR